MMKLRTSPAVLSAALKAAAGLFLVFSPVVVQARDDGKAKDGGGGSSLGDLFNKVKEIKIPDSVSNLPTQLTELKNSYLETSKTLEKLQTEVAALREEMEALKSDNADLRAAVGQKQAAVSRTELLKPVEITSSELVNAFRQDNTTASGEYGNRYLKVIGAIEKFESGVQEIIIYLRSDKSDSLVKCHLKRDANLHAEVLPTQGRMISRNDRTTLLSAGQPVAVLGTCAGYNLDVELMNCRVEGLTATRIEEPEKKK